MNKKFPNLPSNLLKMSASAVCVNSGDFVTSFCALLRGFHREMASFRAKRHGLHLKGSPTYKRGRRKTKNDAFVALEDRISFLVYYIHKLIVFYPLKRFGKIFSWWKTYLKW